MKKIYKIKVEKRTDWDADLSFLGTASNEPGKFAIETGKGAGYFKFFNAANVENMEQAFQNYEEVEKYNRGEKTMCSIRVVAEIGTSKNGSVWTTQEVGSGGLYGIEDERNDLYFADIIADEMDALRDILSELGYSSEEIALADVEKVGFDS